MADAVAALQTKLDGAATAAEVADLVKQLEDAQDDLSELLASNNIYSPTETMKISTQAELDFATNLGGKVAIINGSVEVTQTSTMDATELAAVLAKMTSITGSLKYTATGASVTPTEGFTNLTGVGNLTVDVDGAISFPKLATAADVILTSNSKVTSVSLPLLTTVSSFGGATASDDSMSFSKATSLDLGSLVRYEGGSSLAITIKSGKADLKSFTTMAENGTTKVPTDLEIDGATEIDLALYTEGKILADGVDVVNFPKWKGTATSKFDDASSVTLPAVAGSGDYKVAIMAPKATFFHIIGASEVASTTVTNYPSVTVATQNNLEEMIVGGAMETVSIIGASRLETFTITGTAKNVEVSGTDISEMVLGHTAGKVGTTVALAKNGYLRIQDNDALTSVVADSIDDVVELTIKGNGDLTSVSFAALNSFGTATAAKVEISGNELVIDNIQQASATGEVPVVAKSIQSADFGPLATYIAAAKLKVGTTGKIVVSADEVTKVTSKTGSDVTPVADDKIIANYIPATIVSANDGETAVNMVQEVYIPSGATALTATLQTADGATTVLESPITLTGSQDYYDLTSWASADTKSLFAAAGATLSVGAGRYEGSVTTKMTTGFSYVISLGSESFTVPFVTDDATTLKNLYDMFSATANKIDEDKAFSVTLSSNKLIYTGMAKGSGAKTFSMPTIKGYLDAAGTTAITSTLVSNTTVAATRRADEGYIQFAWNAASADTYSATVTAAGATVGVLAISGTDTALSATGDDESGVVAYEAKVTQSTASADAVKAASVYRVADLVTSAS